MLRKLLSQREFQVLIILFLILTVWWALLNAPAIPPTPHSYIFGAVYGIVALLGAIWGIGISKRWGGTKSVMGSTILFFSLGLLFQEFGQLVFSYYNIFKGNDIPYPSVADIGFFGNIPLYCMGIILMAQATGVQLSLRGVSGKVQVVLLPTIMLILSYSFFLRGYEPASGDMLRSFLDFGYPLGQAFYVSLAALTYSLSKKYLGGSMRPRILLILIALVLQYLADYNFLYQTSRETWVNGGYGDYLYLLAYFLMAASLINMKPSFGTSDEKGR